MIAPLRRRHRALFVVLAVTVPALFLAALAHRPQTPQVSALPAELVGIRPADGRPVQLFADYASQLVLDEAGAHLTLEALAPLRQPDLLVYFSSEAPSASSLPADAHLLGPIAWGQPHTFPLPRRAAEGGHLLLYSLPHQEVTETAEFPGFAAPPAPEPPNETVDEVVDESEGVNS